MCGIAGFVMFGQPDRDQTQRLRTMVQTLTHRGPDETGSAIHHPVAMGMRRLSIIDLSGGTQPIYNEDRTIWTVYNGEIYNFPELRKTLKAQGHHFRTRTDTEVIVHGYEEWGEKFPERLNGMFAIALHDIIRNKFLLVRDHVGIKPLYYSFDRNHLVFGSEVKALLASGFVARELDIDALGEFLAWEYVPGEGTLFKAVRKLEPAKILVIDLNQPACCPKRYWDIPMANGKGVILSSREWEERIDIQIQQSTRRQLISDVPLGAFLSGGVDSSLLVAAMGDAKTFSIGFDDPTYNELGWARQVADHLGVNHTDEIIRPDVVSLFDHLMFFLDDPIGDFSIFPTYLVSRLARRHVTVALSGDGGDELFAGYETYLADKKARLYQRLPDVIHTKILGPIVASLRPTAKKKGMINKAKRFIQGLEHPDETSHARWRIFVGDVLRHQLFSKDAQNEFSTSSSAHIKRLFAHAGERGDLNRSLYVDVKSYLCDNILTKVDRMSMAVSLETRVPYLDPDLIALAFEVPEHLKLGGNVTKKILKQVAVRHIPRKCIYRPKEGFSIPIKGWLSTEFRPLMDRCLDERTLISDGIFNTSIVKRLMMEHRSGNANHSHVLWALIVFQDWKKRWLDGPLPG